MTDLRKFSRLRWTKDITARYIITLECWKPARRPTVRLDKLSNLTAGSIRVILVAKNVWLVMHQTIWSQGHDWEVKRCGLLSHNFVIVNLTVHSTVSTLKAEFGTHFVFRKMDPLFRNSSVWTKLIHSVLDQNFRKIWLNGSRPTCAKQYQHLHHNILCLAWLLCLLHMYICTEKMSDKLSVPWYCTCANAFTFSSTLPWSITITVQHVYNSSPINTINDFLMK